MTHGLETMIQTSVDKTVSGFLTAIKAGMQACGTGGTLFSSLLTEAKESMASAEPYLPANAANTSKAAMPALENNSEERAAHEPSTANKQVSEKPVERAEKPVVQTSDNEKRDPLTKTETDDKGNEAEVKEDGVDCAEGQEAAVISASKQDDSDEDTENKDSQEDEQVMTALLGALIPLDGVKAVRRTGACAEEAGKTDGAVAQADGEATTQAQKVALKNLSEIHQGLMGSDMEAYDDPEAAQTKSAVEKAVKEIASKILTLKEVQQQSADIPSTTDGSVLLAKQTKDAAALSAAEGLQAEKQTTETSQTASQKKTQDVFGLGRSAGIEQTPSQTSSVVAPQQTMLQQAAVSKATEASSEQSGAIKISANQNVIGSGARTVSSYDAAGQLSAARVSKGGTAGLPHAIEQIAVQLNKAAKDGVDTITVQLKPAELGKIEIKLEFAADKSVTGTVMADNQATLALLQKDSSSLHRALQDAGLQTQPGCLEFSLRDQQGSAGQFANQNGNSAQDNGSSGSQAQKEAALLDVALASSIETYYVTPGHVNLSV